MIDRLGQDRSHGTTPAAAADELLALLGELKRSDYRFVTPTPATHARVLARPSRREARHLQDVFGWNLPFGPQLFAPARLEDLLAARIVAPAGEGLFRSLYRVSRLGEDLFLHSPYPTEAEDAVFFGPDSYRFAELIRSELERCPRRPGARLVDIGAGAGVGAIVAARLRPELRPTMTDVNPRALQLARINARAAGVDADYALGPTLEPVIGPVDIALANPPYIVDPAGRRYRDGGDMHGARVALDMAASAMARLSPGGRFILYTGSAIVAGEDRLHRALAEAVAGEGYTLRYREIDPDVFGEELENEAYRDVERIALVAAVITRPG
jgi:hypothetical protein